MWTSPSPVVCPAGTTRPSACATSAPTSRSEGSPLIGAALGRREDARFLTGQGRYVADLTPPGTVHAAFVRSPHAHARLTAIALDEALTAPGVVAVRTGEALARRTRPVVAPSRMKTYRPTAFPPLATGKVRHVGEAIAVVAAETRYHAEDAAERLSVVYEALAVVADVERALESSSPLVHDEAGTNVLLSRTFSQGDAASAMGAAPVRVSDRFRIHRHAGVAIENRGCLAEYRSATAELTLWSSTQVPGILRDALAEILGLPARQIRVVAPDVGGGFGLKTVLYPEEIAVCALAMELERPVKWVGDRREDLLTSTQAWDEVIDAALAVDPDGVIRALRAKVIADVGAYSIYPWTASIEVIQVVSFLPGPYRVPHYHAEAFGVATNKAPMGPYRGVGRPVSVFVMEALLDRAARRLGMDPLEIRRRNLLRSGDFPYRSPSGIVWDSGAFDECLERVCASAGYEALRAEQARERAAGRRLGIGLSTYVELTGVGSAIPVSPGADIATGTEGATIRVDPGGGVIAMFGLAGHGQGHETTMAQVVATELGARVEDVRVIEGDTAVGPRGTGTYASRSAVLGGGAAILAARALRAKALAIAAHELEAGVGDLDLVDGVVTVRGVPGRAIPLARIAAAAYAGGKRLPEGMEPGLEVTRFYDPYFGTASGAAHLAVVDVDPETCAVRVLRYLVVEDCGRIINPLIVEGQAVGGVAQGVGAALLEEVAYSENGQLMTGTLMDYLVPTAAEIPRVEVAHVEQPSPTTLGGFKGVGEGGTIGALAAIANAVADALAPDRIAITELPITPTRLFALLSAAGARSDLRPIVRQRDA